LVVVVAASAVNRSQQQETELKEKAHGFIDNSTRISNPLLPAR
jgi:hypothetical protein